MIRHGIAPFLECSSRGDKRFSARTIEGQYQLSKVFADRARAGRPATRRKHPELLEVLKHRSGLSDIFGQ